jgi:glutaredoxin
LLLETYAITPAPHVVELDLLTKALPKADGHDDDDTPAPTLGRKLQDLLAALTDRRTVPNIMINAQSLGGSDDIAKMDADGTLAAKIQKMGGKRIVSVVKKHKDED